MPMPIMTCPTCRGEGYAPGAECEGIACPECEGLGVVCVGSGLGGPVDRKLHAIRELMTYCT